MSAMTILSIFVFIVVLIVFLEYRNEKKYQQTRRKNRQQTTPSKNTAPSQEQKKAEPRSKPKPEPKIELEPEPKTEILKEIKKLPEANYPKFTHIRLIEMGLTDDEAKEFVTELIPQIETQFPLIEKAMQESDFHQLEQLTHGIKGSASNLGTGGVSDLLADYNTYLKTGTDIEIAKAYFEDLKYYNDELKAQYA